MGRSERGKGEELERKGKMEQGGMKGGRERREKGEGGYGLVLHVVVIWNYLRGRWFSRALAGGDQGIRGLFERISRSQSSRAVCN